MIEDLPLDDRQKAELRGYVALPDGLYEPAALLSGVMDTARPPRR